MRFDLQRFGSGGTTETKQERTIPDQTFNEMLLEHRLMGYNEQAGTLAQRALDEALSKYGSIYTPNWADERQKYIDENNKHIQTYGDLSMDVLNKQEGLLDRYNRDAESAFYDALADYENASREYQGNMRRYLGDYESQAGNAWARYQAAMDKQNPKWEDLVNGILPEPYATNRRAALKDDVDSLYGGTINGAANRGIINSAVTNKALSDGEQNLSDTLAKMFTSDLLTEADLLERQRTQHRSIYDTNMDYAGNLYGTRAGNANDRIGQSGTLFGNRINVAQQNRNNYVDAANTTASGWMQGLSNWLQGRQQADAQNFSSAAAAQDASYTPVQNSLSMAANLISPIQNMYNQMYSGRMGTGSVSTTQSSNDNSGLWGAAGSLGSAWITAAAAACFTGGTLIATPDGYKEIQAIEEGDKVLSVKDGEIVPKTVILVSEPRMAVIVDVHFDNGTVWHTTESQRYFDGKHFNYVKPGWEAAMVRGGKPSQIVRVEDTGRAELVHDFAVEGFAGENVFFANDVAAEGIGD